MNEGVLCAEVPGLIGEASARLFFEHFGGREVYFARRPSAELVGLLGEAPARRLCVRFSGASFYVPKRCEDERRARNRAMRAQFDRLCVNGRTAESVVYELARRYKLSSRTVWRVMGGA